jgi:imidazoleglycerol phosphate synthase cyclase subunit/phosphoribosyl-ATP pyrophosphohydrolase
MTLAVRVIPCLDVANGRVVKGLKFQNLRDAGDPVEAAVRYEAEGADELAFLDVAASHEARGTLVHLVSRVAEVLSIPFTVGGGVRSVEDAAALLSAGADRVTVNTAAVEDPSLLSRLAERFGAQCVVLALDGKRAAGADGHPRMLVTTHGGRRTTEREVAAWAAEAARLGAGEILLSSVDADGTREGFDIEMLRAVRTVADVPLVASGGAGKPEHFPPAVLDGGADAVLAAGIFHDRIFTIGEVKRAMAEAGIAVRIEGGSRFPCTPRGIEPEGVVFDARGLVPVVVHDVRSGDVLTLAWANAEALAKTKETGFSHFFSRSRNALWKKGETSGHVQRVVSISVDCDGDAVLYDVVPEGPACHTGALSCFGSRGFLDPPAPPAEKAPDPPPAPSLDLGPLFAVVADRMRNPQPGSYTNELFEKGLGKIAKKVGEEGVETALAGVSEDDDALSGEAADLLYHLAVLLTARGVSPAEVAAKLRGRRGKRRPR